jgi:hypothetical protein
MSFTAGGFLLVESIKVAKLYMETGDWDKIQKTIFDDNILQYEAKRTTKRIFHEIKIRLQKLNKDLLRILLESTPQEQKIIIWIAICKTYDFIGEFAKEIIREKYLLMNNQLTQEDYIGFFNSKADWHEELDNQSDKTIQKQRQVVFRMLKEAEIISPDNLILPVIPTLNIFKALYKDDPSNLTYLPISDIDIQRLLANAK